MFERYTDRARKVMKLANQEAQRFNHEFIGTEHILLGLVKEGGGVSARVLENLGVQLEKIRSELQKSMQSGPDAVAPGELPYTPRGRKAIEFAFEEARTRGQNYVSTEHLLVALLREDEGVAAEVLTNLGLDVENVREEILKVTEN